MIRGAPKRILAMLAALTAALGLAACGGLGWAGGSGNAVRVLMVNNPQMVDLQKLSGTFTQQTGIKVDFTVLPENDLRDKASLEFASQAGQYDVATLSNFEIPFYSKNNWLTPMDDYIAHDPAFDQADILKPIALSLTGPDRKI
jgi:sorbitol/mannitol transport system substrate-binding protein